MIAIYKHYINKTGISKAFEETKFEGAIASEEPDTVISLTDYNKLREILGYEKVNLQDNEIIINCLKTVKVIFDNYIKENRNINIVGKDLTIKEIRGENLAQIKNFMMIYVILL